MANLLLIDDDPDLLPDQVGHVFPAPAHRVEIARTGTEGLQRVANARPDVILLDLRLPDQSGLEVLKQLRQIDARIPVVLVTVVRSADSAIEAMRQGAYDYLLKPLDMQKLDRVIGEALKVARLMREPAVIAHQAGDLQRLADHAVQFLQVQRLEQVIVSPLPHCFDGRIGGPDHCDQDDRDARVDLAELL